VRQNQFMN